MNSRVYSTVYLRGKIKFQSIIQPVTCSLMGYVVELDVHLHLHGKLPRWSSSI